MIVTEKKLDDIDKQIIKLAGEGKTTKEIAYEVNRKIKTIEARKRVMFEYYKVKSITELVAKIGKLQSMTELEEKILKEAQRQMPAIEKRIQEDAPATRYVHAPIMVDGVIDFVIYDTIEKRFTQIEYSVGTGKGFSLEGNKSAAYYDKKITKVIVIPVS